MNAGSAAVAMALASGAWYGMVCWLAFRAGANADVLLDQISAQQRMAGVIAAGVVVLMVAVVVWRRRTKR